MHRKAIDYQENSLPLHLPVEYVSVCGEFRLDRLQLTVLDDTPVLAAAVDAVSIHFYQRPSANAIRLDRLQLTVLDDTPVLAAAVDAVSIHFYQRPSANAVRMEIQMHTFTVSGTQQGDYVPAMVVSKEVAHDVHLLNIMFETNPLDQSADQRVKVAARPLQIVYDAQTVIRIVEVFKPPEESTALTQLQAAAGNKLSDLKEKSALGMQYAVHQHTFIDLDVDVAPSYIIIPQTGQYRDHNVQCAVVKLGAIRLKSEPRAAGGPLDVAKLYRSGLDDDHVMAEIAKHSYDKITLALTQMQAGGPLDVAKLYRSGLDDDHVMAEIAKHSYDKITLALTQMQAERKRLFTPGGQPLDVAKLYRSGLDDDHVMAEIAKHSYDKITLALTQMQVKHDKDIILGKLSAEISRFLIA
ncbi:repeating coiled region of VPS13 domain-containing protein [Phthorimaea operculella]|nr:repeating coiled region of VPS13 domain-containing protein [Phthorimaea operculella]